MKARKSAKQFTNFEDFLKDRKQVESDQRNNIGGKLNSKHLQKKTAVETGAVSGSFKLRSQLSNSN